MANCNFRQNSTLLDFWNMFIKQAKSSEKNKIQFLKSLAPALHKYSNSLQKLKENPETQKIIHLLNSPNFHFLTLDLLSSVYLNYICQINSANLLEETEELITFCVPFLYEGFGIIKDENVKNKTLSFCHFLFEKPEFLKKLYYREETINRAITRGFQEDNSIIFLTFLNYFTESVLKNNEVNFNFRNRFFQEVKNLIDGMKGRELGEHQNKIVRFFCIFFQKLVNGKEIINCLEVFQTLKNYKFNDDFLSENVINL